MKDLLVQHQFPLRAKCPVDGSEDAYNVIVSANRTIPVEEILAVAEGLTLIPSYQEEITRELAQALRAEVVTHGIHSGVYTTCRCSC